ncbi:hypothetical protein [Nannocystis exedens]|nr:hypothetical protein [Nannocystis exedens]
MKHVTLNWGRCLALSAGILVAGAAAEAHADPTLLWSTYIGGVDGSTSYDVCFDGNAALISAGITASSTGIAGSTAGNFTHDATLSSLHDAYITKFDSAGTRLWGTYYGGSGNDWFNKVTAAPGDFVFAVGNTASPNTNNVIATLGDTTLDGAQDAMLVKFSATGSRQWGRYLGGNGIERGQGVCAASSGTVYVVGATTSTNLETNSGSHQPDKAGDEDAFIAKITSAGDLVWITYYGGDDGETAAQDCVVDRFNNIYVVGATYASNGIALNGWDNTHTGSRDAFLAKFNTNGVLLEATYYGGTGDDVANAVDLDASNNVYIAGATTSPDTSLDLIDTIGTSLEGDQDGFVVMFDTTLSRVWGRYYGGTEALWATEGFHDLEIEGNAVLLSGNTSAADNISTSDAFWTDFGGEVDGMFVALDSTNGDEFFATYIAGTGEDADDRGWGVAGTFAHAAVAGAAGGPGIATAGAHDSVFDGGEAFLMLIRMFSM